MKNIDVLFMVGDERRRSLVTGICQNKSCDRYALYQWGLEAPERVEVEGV